MTIVRALVLFLLHAKWVAIPTKEDFKRIAELAALFLDKEAKTEPTAFEMGTFLAEAFEIDLSALTPEQDAIMKKDSMKWIYYRYGTTKDEIVDDWPTNSK